ncbi:DUF4097 family beta strand repeat-containing protein [Saccharomonospora azurea]
MSRVGLAVGGVVLVVAGVAVATNWSFATTSERTDTVAAAIRHVEIDNGSGRVVVRAGEVSETVVEQRLAYVGDEPGRAFEVEGSTLVLAGCGSDCSVDYEVTVPRGVTVAGEVSSGDVVVRDASDVDVRATSGDVEVRLTGARRVAVEATSGDVDLHVAEVEEVHATTTSGDMNLDVEQVDTVRAEATSGDIEVTAPRGDYRVTVSTTSGDQDVRGDDPGAERVLDLTATSGDVTVRGV